MGSRHTVGILRAHLFRHLSFVGQVYSLLGFPVRLKTSILHFLSTISKATKFVRKASKLLKTRRFSDIYPKNMLLFLCP